MATRGRVADAVMNMLSPSLKGQQAPSEPLSPWKNASFACLVCSKELGEGQRATAFYLCAGQDAPRGHAAVCTTCFSRTHAKKAPFALVQLAARVQREGTDGAWTRASEIDFQEGLPAKADDRGDADPDGTVLAYVTYDSSSNSGEMVCPECWENGARCARIQPKVGRRIPNQAEDADGSDDARCLMDDIDAEPLGVQARQEEHYMPPAAEITHLDRFARLCALENSTDEQLAAILAMTRTGMVPCVRQLIVSHLKWNDSEGTADVEDFDKAWTAMLLAVQDRLKTLREEATKTDVNTPSAAQVLHKFVEKSLIYLETGTPGMSDQLGAMAAKLPDIVQGGLMGASFVPEAKVFDEKRPDVLSQRLRSLLPGTAVGVTEPARSSQVVRNAGTVQGGTTVAGNRAAAALGMLPTRMAQDPRLNAEFDWSEAATAFTQLGLDPESATHYAQAAAAVQAKRTGALPLSAAPTLAPAAGLGPAASEPRDSGVEERQQLMDLFNVHLHASDQERCTGFYTIPNNALTLYLKKETFVHACKNRRGPAETARDYFTFRSKDDVDPKFVVAAEITYLNAFSQEELDLWFKLAKQYVIQHAEPYLPLFKRVKRWIWNQTDNKVEELTSFSFRSAQTDTDKERRLHMALGRLYMLVHYAHQNKPRSLADLTEELRRHNEKMVDLTEGKSARHKFQQMGFVRVAAGTQLIKGVTFEAREADQEAHRLTLVWKGLNASPCLNCGVSGHTAGHCKTKRRDELPCSLCYVGKHSESQCTGFSDLDPDQHTLLAQAFWRKRTLASAGAGAALSSGSAGAGH